MEQHLVLNAIHEQPKVQLKLDDAWSVEPDGECKQPKSTVETLRKIKRQLSKDLNDKNSFFMYTDCTFCMHMDCKYCSNWDNNGNSSSSSNDCFKCSECSLQESLSCDCFNDIDFSKYFSCLNVFGEVMN